MDYLEIEIDSTYATISDSSVSPQDNPKINVGRTLSNVVGAKILEVNIPFSYYVISNRQEPAILTPYPENDMALFFSPPYNPTGVLSSVFSIPVGNYTGTSLASVLQTFLQTIVVGLPVEFPPPATATCSYDTRSNKFTFTITQGPAGSLNLALQMSNSMSAVLGLSLTLYPIVPANLNRIFALFTPQTVATSYTLTSTKIASITGPNILYVNSRILGNVCKAYLPEGTLSVGETNPQLAMVPVNVNPGGIIWWQDPAPQEVFDTKHLFSLQALDLYITAGTDPRPLLFNGLGFQIKLMLFIKNAEESTSQAGTLGQNRSVLSIRAN